jgi:DNA-binding MarR family transcriptional regulator
MAKNIKKDDIILADSVHDNRLRTVLEILQTASSLNNLHLQYLKPYSLSVQQYNILRVLRESYPDSLTVFAIKEKMVDKTPNTTRMVDKLLSNKLVTRIRSNKDRRKVYVKITNKGLEVMSKIDIIQQDFLKLTDKLSLHEAGQLSNILEKLRQ